MRLGKRFFFIHIIFIFIIGSVPIPSFAQCSSSIITYPYFEDFESTNGNWFAGGNASDWAWGTPTKQVINKAFSGIKCWITGGLNKTSYSNGQSSYLQSPCFDFTGLANPYLSFKIFWETERRYDGASMQYSVDSGKTFLTLGTYNDGIACPADNWFNTQSINTLSSAGWSGNIQNTSPCAGGSGGGLGKWVAAKHSLSFLKNETHVIFRFTFGAGTQCNTYDGFAIDDVTIGEAPPIAAAFTYTCGDNFSVQFSAADVPCPGTYLWNFGDPTSGNNTSTAQLATHTFSAPGSYLVSLQIVTVNSVFIATNKTVTVIGVTANITNAIKCYGDSTATLTAVVNGPPDNYTYTWNTQPVQNTATITQIPAGTYEVSVKGTQTCNTKATAVVTAPTKITTSTSFTNPLCTNNGSISLTPTGGTPIYTYTWNIGGYTSSAATGLAAGLYKIAVSDVNKCVDTAQVVLVNEPNTLSISLGNDTTLCPGETLVLNAGNFASYIWQDQSTNSSFNATQTGNYAVTVTDVNGCTATARIKVTFDCTDVIFPNAFTPNGNGRNDSFGALGNVTALRNYRLQVYNRFGNVVFSTTNPFEKWNGKVNGIVLSGTYVWYATYQILDKKTYTQKGTLLILQ